MTLSPFSTEKKNLPVSAETARYLRNSAIRFAILTALVLAFSLIYEIAGHGIHAAAIRTAPVLPLAGAILLFSAYKLAGKNCFITEKNEKCTVAFTVTLKGFLCSLLCSRILRGIGEVYGSQISNRRILTWLAWGFLTGTAVLTVILTVQAFAGKKNRGGAE